MNIKRYVYAALAAFVFMFAYDFVVHGWLLAGQYQATQTVWRSEAEMQALYPWLVVSSLLLAFLFAFIFTRHYENRGLSEGLRFGLYIGLLMGILQFSSYAFLPIPLSLAVIWLITGILEGLGVGAVLALVYRQNGTAA